MVSAPPRPPTLPSTAPRTRFAPVRVPLPEGSLTWERFLSLGDDNPGYRFERHGENELVITMGSGRRSDVRAARIAAMLVDWSDAEAGGDVTASGGISEADDGSWLIPDASWMSRQRAAESGGETGEGPGAVPELVVEIASWTDRIADLKRKMERWIRHGAPVSWLIDPYDRIVWIYRPGQAAEELREPSELAGDPALPGLVVPLDRIWAGRGR